MITDRPQFFRVNRFTDLLDTPNTYIGQAGRLPRVNQGASLLEFQDPSITGITNGWELIRTGTFTGDTNITGLDGNADRLWMLVIRTKHTAGHFVSCRFNGDAAANYWITRHRVGLSAGASQHDIFVGGGQDGLLPASWTSLETFVIIYISPVTGQNRIATMKAEQLTDVNSFFQVNTTGIWINTINNITTINIVTTTITAGEFFLFRRR